MQLYLLENVQLPVKITRAASRGLNWLGHTKLCNLAGLDRCWLDTIFQGKIQNTNKVDPIKISNKWICIEEFQQLIVMVDYGY
jgi:hypothetical protein